MAKRDDEILIRWLEQVPLRTGVLIAVVLLVIGQVLSMVVPLGAGWLSLLAFSKNLLWALAVFVVVVVSFASLRRMSDGRLFDSGVHIEHLTWQQFEGYLAEFYRRHGAGVTYRGGASADGGVDLVLDDASGRRIVQAKRWKTRRVPVQLVRELWGVREDERATGAVFVTSGTFTPDAIRFARGKQLELVDGSKLRSMVRELKGFAPPAPSAESCPKCGVGVLKRRTARRGANAGSEFLGCSRYPACTYTRSV